MGSSALGVLPGGSQRPVIIQTSDRENVMKVRGPVEALATNSGIIFGKEME